MGGIDKDTMASSPIVSSLPAVPITEQRRVFMPTDEDVLTNAGTARANIAADRDHPEGTTAYGNYAARNQNRTVLQQHCDYWDTDHDGVIWPWDTYVGIRKWGWNPFLSLFATAIISGLSYPTVPGYLPDPFFRIYLDKIYKAKHGSDSMSYDSEGRFSPQHFENIFAKYDRDNKGGLNFGDVLCLLKGSRLIFDFFGWMAMSFEWVAMYLLIWPADGVMKKEDIRGVYDGSIFYVKAGEYDRLHGKANGKASH